LAAATAAGSAAFEGSAAVDRGGSAAVDRGDSAAEILADVAETADAVTADADNNPANA
jgi:hypothetical protein